MDEADPMGGEAVERRADAARKGRGAVSNATGRYETLARIRTDDGWADDDDPPPLRTTVGVDSSRTIIARNSSPDIPFDRSINPYRGCEHGCVYCFARPTHAHLGLSPGLDFETRLFAKPEAAALLDAELRKPGYAPAVMALGSNTDPYQPIERERRITRSVIQVLSDFNHPLGIVTKSTLVLRDLDILADMARRNLVRVAVSITTLDRELARRMEPRAPTPARRLAAVEGLAQAGVPVHVLMAPVIPAVNDPEIEAVVAASAKAGALGVGHVLLRLPLEIKDLVGEWLAEHYPDRAARVLSLVRQTRGGALYRSTWGERMRGIGPYADLVARRFEMARKRNGLTKELAPLDTTRFRPPPRPGDQLSLL
jgi:DNA repair photolyase